LGIDVARSGTSEMGTVTMAFTTRCDGPLHLWALVWDAIGGPSMENADSLYVSVDGGEEQAWLYGCVTEEDVDTRWRWLPVGFRRVDGAANTQTSLATAGTALE
jgi:hypothetical protein